LAQAARGELLLFTDADTRHAPGALAAAVAALRVEGADLVTALPRQDVITWGERLIVPILGWSLFCFLPVGLAHRLQWPPLSASIGQFMLMRRDVYARAGGHGAVRAHAADDLALGRRVMAAGGRWRLVDAGPMVRCRMYTGFGEAVAGLSKNLYAAFDYRAGLFVPIWAWVGTAFVAPALTLLLAALGLPLPAPALALAAAAALLAAGLWAVFAWRFGLPVSLPLSYPASVLLAVVIALRSLLLTLTGRATWKGRTIA
jgi:chlorobactene glucosyltransferase